MHKFRKKSIIILLVILTFASKSVFAVEKSNNSVSSNNTYNSSSNSSTYNSNANNNSNSTNEDSKNELEQESTATTILKIKDEQLKSLDDYKAKYGSDTYGFAAYVLHLVQVYSIPIGLVGIALCAIYQYVIGMKRLDIRDKGFNTMIAMVTVLIICQVLPLIFAVVVKSND